MTWPAFQSNVWSHYTSTVTDPTRKLTEVPKQVGGTRF